MNMENSLDSSFGHDRFRREGIKLVQESIPLQPMEDKSYKQNVKSIDHSEGQWVISDSSHGVYSHGVQYYDLQNIEFINNSGIAHLIEVLKSLLEEGIEVRFVNVNENIKNKIKALGLEHVITCL